MDVILSNSYYLTGRVATCVINQVLRQRQIALETLVHVTQRARHAMYTGYVKQSMLHLLLDSGTVVLHIVIDTLS